MPDHPLDNPIWESLASEHASLAVGFGAVRRYPSDIGPLAGMVDGGDGSSSDLRRCVETSGPIILAQVAEINVPSDIQIDWHQGATQLVFGGEEFSGATNSRIERLGDRDAEEMLALALLTEPGPFAERSHVLGQFWGIKEDGRLVAMAGERMRLTGFTELSAICTHPDFQGRGFGKALTTHVCQAILHRGERPFLHAFDNNHSAIRLYETLGFRRRARLNVMGLAPA